MFNFLVHFFATFHGKKSKPKWNKFTKTKYCNNSNDLTISATICTYSSSIACLEPSLCSFIFACKKKGSENKRSTYIETESKWFVWWQIKYSIYTNTLTHSHAHYHIVQSSIVFHWNKNLCVTIVEQPFFCFVFFFGALNTNLNLIEWIFRVRWWNGVAKIEIWWIR